LHNKQESFMKKFTVNEYLKNFQRMYEKKKKRSLEMVLDLID